MPRNPVVVRRTSNADIVKTITAIIIVLIAAVAGYYGYLGPTTAHVPPTAASAPNH
jgi:hypothetical protein